MEKDIFCEKSLKRSIRDSKVREEDIDLILRHLEHTGKLDSKEIKIANQQTRIIKLGKVKGPPPKITQKELAMFTLEENITAIEQKISELQIKQTKLKT